MEIAAANVEEGVVELEKAESIVVRASKQIRLSHKLFLLSL